MKQILITGHLGRDAVQRNSNGADFISFTVGVSEKVKDSQGQPMDKTDWFSVISKHKGVLPYLKKGTKVLVQGRFNAKIYRNTNTGQDAIDYTINADAIELLSAANTVPATGPTDSQATTASPATPGAEKADDDLPF
ncbi:single-stranded DNA-binding protein [Dyadobacter sp. OTU695]|uniref:single-stranded DNA-binding protein n=1 Tax=Dyadobacter sp. OTU695 TaxID=3043860 RepID=UPI00313BBFB2